MPFVTHHHSPPSQYFYFCIICNIGNELLPWNHLILLPPKSWSCLCDHLPVQSADGAMPYYLQGDAWHCSAHKGQQRETDRLKALEKKRKKTKSSCMKDKNKEDEKIERQINQVKESDRGKREKWGEGKSRVRFCHVGWKLCLLGSGHSVESLMVPPSQQGGCEGTKLTRWQTDTQ